MITVTGVTKKYGDSVVLHNVSLTIPKGGLTCLVGPNGAGKSTLLSIVARLGSADEGSVTIDGENIATIKSQVLATRLSVLRQENHVAARVSVRELVGMGRFPHSRGRPTSADNVRIDQALDFLDLVEVQHRYLDQLSGGQRQRAFVAMVVAQDTDYILLDEPLNNLDIEHSVQMMGLLRRAADELEKTIVVVVHDINFASAYADHIIAMVEGRVVCAGTPLELMRSDVLGGVFHTPVSIHHYEGRAYGLYYRHDVPASG